MDENNIPEKRRCNLEWIEEHQYNGKQNYVFQWANGEYESFSVDSDEEAI